jgi:hypothetical protein
MPSRRSLLKSVSRWRSCARKVGRDAILWLSLVAFALVAGGVPLAEAPRIGGGAFACQSKRCGCSATSCAINCCCAKPKAKADSRLTPVAQVKVMSCCAAKLKQSQPATDVALAVEQGKCRGTVSVWLSLGALLALAERQPAKAESVVERLALVDEWTLSTADRPEAPPPKTV